MQIYVHLAVIIITVTNLYVIVAFFNFQSYERTGMVVAITVMYGMLYVLIKYRTFVARKEGNKKLLEVKKKLDVRLKINK